MKIINLIKELRKNYKSENKMSIDLGISRQALKYIEEGINHPSDETIIKICKKLGKDAQEYIVINDIEKSKGEAKTIRENIAKKLSSVAASILVAALLSPIFIESLNVYYVKLKKMIYVLCYRGQIIKTA